MLGVPELTPVAIQSGKMLANRLYKQNVSEAMDYNLIATTVFTPTEYGAIGLSEEDAIAKFGKDSIEVYHSSFTPLEWSLTAGRPENTCYAKLVCDKNDDERVLGLHYLGPDAGEVVQVRLLFVVCCCLLLLLLAVLDFFFVLFSRLICSFTSSLSSLFFLLPFLCLPYTTAGLRCCNAMWCHLQRFS